MRNFFGAPSLRLITVLGLVSATLFVGWNWAGLSRRDASPRLGAPTASGQLLQRAEQAEVTARDFLCRHPRCDGATWPEGESPEAWLAALGQGQAKRRSRPRPLAPALLRYEGRWWVLWTEASDRLEVLLQGQGSGLLPPGRFADFEGAPWWGPLR